MRYFSISSDRLHSRHHNLSTVLAEAVSDCLRLTDDEICPLHLVEVSNMWPSRFPSLHERYLVPRRLFPALALEHGTQAQTEERMEEKVPSAGHQFANPQGGPTLFAFPL